MKLFAISLIFILIPNICFSADYVCEIKHNDNTDVSPLKDSAPKILQITYLKKTNELVLVTEKAYNGFKRITMGLDLINEISYKLLIIKGEKKLKTLFSKNETLPISNIKYKHIFYLK